MRTSGRARSGTRPESKLQRTRNVSQYALYVTTDAETTSLRNRLYVAYASQHAGCEQGDAARLIYRRDIRPALPKPWFGPVVDIGCGQGALVRLMLADGYEASGVDVSPEQVALARAAGLDLVEEGDYRELLASRADQLAAVVATDVLEHLTKPEVLETFDCVGAALMAGGVFIARVPNAGSPFGGNTRYGDFTHESSYTERSIQQLAAAAGFASVAVASCPPIAHGLVSALRVALWKPISALYQIVLAAETGVMGGHIVTQNLTFVAHKRSTGRQAE
jgi:2-polyprenyl-3-methyl-5-hydroxy-6-metoxy-1,4-benzoquinol methylase